MNYEQIYNNLISSRLKLKEERIQQNKLGVYFEGHHIIPKSQGGLGKSKNYNHLNIVPLTPKEHFIAHLLLYKINPCKENIQSLWLMGTTYRYKKLLKIGSRVYEELKEKYCNELSKSTLQYSKEGEFIKEWKNRIEVENVLNISNSNISKCCKNKNKLVGGFQWRNKESESYPLKIESYNKIYKQNIKVIQYSLQGNFIKEWNGIKGISKILNLKTDDSNITMCCKNKIKSAGSFQWRYKTENYPLKIESIDKNKRKGSSIIQYNLNEEVVREWSSILEAKHYFQGDIQSCLKGRQKTACGFKWKYKYL